MSVAQPESQDSDKPGRLTSPEQTEEAASQLGSLPAQSAASQIASTTAQAAPTRPTEISPVLIRLNERLEHVLKHIGDDQILRNYPSLTVNHLLEGLNARLLSADYGSHTRPTPIQLAWLMQLSLLLFSKQDVRALDEHIFAWRASPSLQPGPRPVSDHVTALQSADLIAMTAVADRRKMHQANCYLQSIDLCMGLAQSARARDLALAGIVSDNDSAADLAKSAAEARASIGQSDERSGVPYDIFSIWLADEVGPGKSITARQLHSLSREYQESTKQGYNICILVDLFGEGVVPWLIKVKNWMPILTNINPAHLRVWCQIVQQDVKGIETLYHQLDAGIMDSYRRGLKVTAEWFAFEYDVDGLCLQDILAVSSKQNDAASEDEMHLGDSYDPEDDESFEDWMSDLDEYKEESGSAGDTEIDYRFE